MGLRPFHRITTRRGLATWLALGVLFWQTLFSAGAFEPPMAPLQLTNAGLVICSLHGLETLPAGDGVPGHNPSDRSVPPCPCCLSFTAVSSTILAEGVTLPTPEWVKTAPPRLVTIAPPPRRAIEGPLQPRAPPLSI